jgi:hypothetical protein
MTRRRDGQAPDQFWAQELEEIRRPTLPLDPGDSIDCAHLAAKDAVRGMRILLLRRFGRIDWADREKRLLEEELPVPRRGRTLLCLGLPDLAIRVAIAAGSAPTSLRYPRPYPDWVAVEASRAGISPQLVWALARRESLFDPGALSGAGAKGVLQMMESTARETSDRWGIPAGPLERADRNLALGVSHFRDLLDHPDWHLPALLAAYNAGAAKTGEWVARFPDPDLFIERIGWRETRDYVRHVLDGYWVYRSAYSPDAGEGSGQ